MVVVVLVVLVGEGSGGVDGGRRCSQGKGPGIGGSARVSESCMKGWQGGIFKGKRKENWRGMRGEQGNMGERG